MNIFPAEIEELLYVGYTILGIGVLFFVLSVFALRKKGIGDVVDNGIYGVIRHPMYLGAIIMFFSHILLGQSWVVSVNTLIGITCCYLIILSEDKQNVEKFGYKYLLYMHSVPRINILLGIVRAFFKTQK